MLEEIEKNQKLKIVELGLQQRVYEAMKSPTFSANSFCEELKKEGINISVPSILKFISKSKDAQTQFIKEDIKLANELKTLTTDYTKALKDILNEVEEVKNTVKNEKDYVTYNQLIGRLMQGIELIAKISGELNPNNAKIDIKYVYNEINMNIEKDMKRVKDAMMADAIVDVDAEIIKESGV